MSKINCEYNEISDYKSAFECFKQRFLDEKKSIFRLEDKNEILTKDSIKYLIDNFANNGYSGDASFIDKIKHQLITEPKNALKNENIKKNAIEILATAVWLWRLPPRNAKDRKTSVEEILSYLIQQSQLIIIIHFLMILKVLHQLGLITIPTNQQN